MDDYCNLNVIWMIIIHTGGKQGPLKWQKNNFSTAGCQCPRRSGGRLLRSRMICSLPPTPLKGLGCYMMLKRIYGRTEQQENEEKQNKLRTKRAAPVRPFPQTLARTKRPFYVAVGKHTKSCKINHCSRLQFLYIMAWLPKKNDTLDLWMICSKFNLHFTLMSFRYYPWHNCTIWPLFCCWCIWLLTRALEVFTTK